MNEIETLFATNVWNNLKKSLKGRIFCKVINNTLQVSVKCYDVVFRKDFSNIAEKIITGELTGESCAQSIVSDYRAYIWEDTKKKYYY